MNLVRQFIEDARSSRDELIRRFVAWADDVKRRGDAGEFGKWPWQDGYDEVGLWGKRRSTDGQKDADQDRKIEGSE